MSQTVSVRFSYGNCFHLVYFPNKGRKDKLIFQKSLLNCLYILIHLPYPFLWYFIRTWTISFSRRTLLHAVNQLVIQIQIVVCLEQFSQIVDRICQGQNEVRVCLSAIQLFVWNENMSHKNQIQKKKTCLN